MNSLAVWGVISEYALCCLMLIDAAETDKAMLVEITGNL